MGGAAGCRNVGNNSIVLAMAYHGKRFLFTGDAGASTGTGDYRCSGGEIQELLRLYGRTDFLKTDVYKVAAHGFGGSSNVAWLKAISPQISVISAGRDTQRRTSWLYPEESVVKSLESFTSGNRPRKTVPTTINRRNKKSQIVNKAVYCTCWDGDIVIDAATLEVSTPKSPSRTPPESRTSGLDLPIGGAGRESSALSTTQSLAAFDMLSPKRQREVLSESGPQLPAEIDMNNIQMRGFIKGGWPFFVFYSLKSGSATLSISADGIEPFTKVLSTGSKEQAVFTIPERFGTEPNVANISISSSGGLELYAIGILEKVASTRSNHPRYRVPVEVDLPIGDIAVDRDKIVAGSGQEVSYRFFSRSPYTAGAAEFFLFIYDPQKGVIARRIFSSQYDNIRSNEFTKWRKWSGQDRRGSFSLGVHRLQIRTWRGQDNGSVWFGPYYGPQLQVIQ